MNDYEIVTLYFKRDEAAISETEKKYGAYCFKIAHNILGYKEDVEECLNDMYHHAWNAIPPTRPDSLAAFVCQIVRNVSVKCYHKKRALKRNSTYDVAMEEIEACLASASMVEDEAETRELARIIEGFLDTLSQENRVIFLQRYWFSEPYSAIAKKVGISEKSVSVRLARIRKKLREYLVEREVLV